MELRNLYSIFLLLCSYEFIWIKLSFFVFFGDFYLGSEFLSVVGLMVLKQAVDGYGLGEVYLLEDLGDLVHLGVTEILPHQLVDVVLDVLLALHVDEVDVARQHLDVLLDPLVPLILVKALYFSIPISINGAHAIPGKGILVGSVLVGIVSSSIFFSFERVDWVFLQKFSDRWIEYCWSLRREDLIEAAIAQLPSLHIALQLPVRRPVALVNISILPISVVLTNRKARCSSVGGHGRLRVLPCGLYCLSSMR